MALGSLGSLGSTAPPELDELLDRAEQARLRGDYQAGAAYARQAVEVAAGPGRARALRSLANQLLRLGLCEEAIATSREAITIMEALGDHQGVCSELTVFGLACTELGLFEEALEALGRAREIAVAIGDRGALYWVHNRTGVVHSCMGDHQQADAHLLRALALADDMDTEAKFCILNNLADNAIGLVPALRAQHRHTDADTALVAALDQAEKALDLAQAAHHTNRTSICLDNYGMLLGLAGQYDAAFEAIGESLALAVSYSYRSLESSALQHRARLHLLDGNARRAVDGLEEALHRAKATGEKPIAMAAHRELCGAYEQLGDYRSALTHYRQFHLLEREARSDAAAARARLATHHFELDNARLEADNARLEAELHRIRSNELEADKQMLQQQAIELDRYAHEDALTGLANRRWADLRLPELLGTDRPVCLAIGDVDRFKGVNDRYGHLVGDEVLRQVAAILKANAPGDAFLARLGGEEFLIAFVDMSVGQAYRTCQRLRALVSEYTWNNIDHGLAVTISFGVAEHQPGLDHQDLLARADAGLYSAKHNGRDRVELADAGPAVGRPRAVWVVFDRLAKG